MIETMRNGIVLVEMNDKDEAYLKAQVIPGYQKFTQVLAAAFGLFARKKLLLC